MDYQIIKTMRIQAWERAKGELGAMLATTWSGVCDDQNVEKLNSSLTNTVEDFIDKVEEELFGK